MMEPNAAEAQPLLRESVAGLGSRPRTATLGLLLLGLICGCETIRTETAPQPDMALAYSHPVRAWKLVQAGEEHGFLIRFNEAGTQRGYYMVQNLEQQDLGLVDLLGRAWRYRALSPDPEWLGTGTVLLGAQRILGLAGPAADQAELREVALASLKNKTR